LGLRTQPSEHIDHEFDFDQPASLAVQTVLRPPGDLAGLSTTKSPAWVRRERLYSEQKKRVNVAIAFFLPLSIMELNARV
jgi:hypothetical protein